MLFMFNMYSYDAITKEDITSTSIVMQYDLVGCSEKQQIRSGYVILDLESINDLRTLLENLDTL